ncbi:outer membrane protein transport protein [uncultured Tateyamaria sp.]|uniref:OmpP1/FadL family transporter n=1 Tax=uncultured Tateyamaria sp. TaxID=455651 RepID=UPI002628AE93|nr:outer membrane protein transport protein [uncultured Tateyamaria sp.]
MKTIGLAATALVVSAVAAQAVGLDRSGRPTSFIFEDGNMVEFSFGGANPSIDGSDVFTNPTGNIGDSFAVWGAGIRYQASDKLSFGLIIDEPYGADIMYGPSSTVLDGTAATVDSSAYTAFARYKFNDNFSVHGGLVYQNVSANVTLSGLAYQSSGLNGYNAAFSNDGAFGYMVGAAYEIPRIALRVALTYHSEIDHSLDTTQTINGVVVAPPSATDVTTPETIALDFQTGVAADTLVFGSIRFSHYSVTSVRPTALGGASLTDLENGFDVSLGVGRRFSEKWAGSATVGWSQKGEDDLVSPLGSTNGSVFLALGASYQLNEKTEISGGVRYTDFGNAIPNVGGNPVGAFGGDSAVSAGFRIQYSF